MTDSKRRAGLLLHPTALPSGQLDNDAERWMDFLHEAGISLWQVLPLGVPLDELSPYLCQSAFALNPALYDLEADAAPDQLSEADNAAFEQWRQQQSYWLDDYATFVVLKQHFEQQPWYHWPEDYRDHRSAVLATFCAAERDSIIQVCYQQYRLAMRWQQIKQYAHDKGIALFGDLPIFVAHDSADVWAQRECFLLNDEGQPSHVAGVPPDYFSEDGQRWGNPHYNWDYLQRDGFSWWMQRVAYHFEQFDLIRIDHFRGLEAAWMIDAECPTAVDGFWQEAPGEALLKKMKSRWPELPIVAEDLGVITDEVVALRDQFELPGMSVLQFAFDDSADNPHKPKNIDNNRVVYTGTHDNDTSVGWYQALETHQQEFVCEQLALDEDSTAEAVCQQLQQTALDCDADLAVIPLQDCLLLDSKARFNTPGTVDNNWRWRFSWDQIPNDLAANIRSQLQSSQRLIRDVH